MLVLFFICFHCLQFFKSILQPTFKSCERAISRGYFSSCESDLAVVVHGWQAACLCNGTSGPSRQRFVRFLFDCDLFIRSTSVVLKLHLGCLPATKLVPTSFIHSFILSFIVTQWFWTLLSFPCFLSIQLALRGVRVLRGYVMLQPDKVAVLGGCVKVLASSSASLASSSSAVDSSGAVPLESSASSPASLSLSVPRHHAQFASPPSHSPFASASFSSPLPNLTSQIPLSSSLQQQQQEQQRSLLPPSPRIDPAAISALSSQSASPPSFSSPTFSSSPFSSVVSSRSICTAHLCLSTLFLSLFFLFRSFQFFLWGRAWFVLCWKWRRWCCWWERIRKNKRSVRSFFSYCCTLFVIFFFCFCSVGFFCFSQ